MLTLTPAERKAHKADAHHLDPVVLIGSGGLTEAVIKEADAALKAHGLVKIRAGSDDRAERGAWLETLCERLGAAPVQHLGKIFIVWRPRPALVASVPEDRKPGPRIVTLVKPSRSATHRPVVKKVRVLGNQRVTQGGSIKRSKSRSPSKKKL